MIENKFMRLKVSLVDIIGEESAISLGYDSAETRSGRKVDCLFVKEEKGRYPYLIIPNLANIKSMLEGNRTSELMYFATVKSLDSIARFIDLDIPKEKVLPESTQIFPLAERISIADLQDDNIPITPEEMRKMLIKALMALMSVEETHGIEIPDTDDNTEPKRPEEPSNAKTVAYTYTNTPKHAIEGFTWKQYIPVAEPTEFGGTVRNYVDDGFREMLASLNNDGRKKSK